MDENHPPAVQWRIVGSEGPTRLAFLQTRVARCCARDGVSSDYLHRDHRSGGMGSL